MEDLLIDVNVAVDVCAHRSPHAEASVYRPRGDSGCTPAVFRRGNTTRWGVLKRQVGKGATPAISNRAHHARTRELLREFTADKHWLAALAGEGPVFGSPDPEDEHLVRALDRFAPGGIRLLTRDEPLC